MKFKGRHPKGGYAFFICILIIYLLSTQTYVIPGGGWWLVAGGWWAANFGSSVPISQKCTFSVLVKPE